MCLLAIVFFQVEIAVGQQCSFSGLVGSCMAVDQCTDGVAVSTEQNAVGCESAESRKEKKKKKKNQNSNQNFEISKKI
jgi:hypothetical protein